MVVTEMDPVPKGENVFNHDYVSMGITLGMATDSSCMGNRILAMMRNHPNDKMDWVIIVNEKTGERIQITF